MRSFIIYRDFPIYLIPRVKVELDALLYGLRKNRMPESVLLGSVESVFALPNGQHDE